MMLVSGLKTAEPDAVRYFRIQFARDLARVGATATHMEPARLSVASFCPDYPKVPIYSGPARAFARLPEQRWFLGCLLVTQLAAQASHAKGTIYYFGPPAVLVGLLSSYWNIVHPRFLLLVLALYREAVEAPDTGAGLQAILQDQIGEIHNSEGLTSRLTLDAMRAGLHESEMPASLGPFVPSRFQFSPDQLAIREWHACLYRLLEDAAA
jgi:hypothetical protein